MGRWRHAGWARSFGEEEPVADDTPRAGEEAPPTAEADYSFEGYSVEFLDKVALMPAAPAAAKPGPKMHG